MKKSPVIIIILVLTLAVTSFCAANEAYFKAAGEAAEKWLALIDEGDYAGCYDMSAQLAKDMVPKERWMLNLSLARDPLGKVVSRMLHIVDYKTSLPGAPDGDYIIIQYKTVFEKKPLALETITPMLDKDGKWRVAGYYISDVQFRQ